MSSLLRIMVFFTIAHGLALTLTSCKDSSTIIDGKAYWVSGTVSDTITQLPVDSALVNGIDTLHAAGGGVYSDSLGKYRVQVPASAARVYVRKPGYVPAVREFQVLAAC